MLKRFQVEVGEEVGDVGDFVITSHHLGRVLADPGMTNNHPYLYAVEVTPAVLDSIEPGLRVNPDVRELDSGAIVVPRSRFASFMDDVDHGFFHATINRLVWRGIIIP